MQFSVENCTCHATVEVKIQIYCILITNEPVPEAARSKA